MDPKNLSNLDPKLRETYERVMGTATASSPSTTPPQMPVPASSSPMPTFDAMPATTPTPINTTETTPQIPPPTDASMLINQPIQNAELSTLQSTLTPITSLPQTPKTFQPLPSPAEINQLPAQSSSSVSPLIRILYIIAGIIFFAVYIIFWLKIFKFPLPF